MQRPRWSSRLAAAAGLGLLSLGAALVFAQVPPGPGRGPRFVPNQRAQARAALVAARQNDDELLLDGVFLPPDRTAKRRLDMAQQMIGQSRYGEAVRLLGSLLENSEDFFFKPDAARPVYRSLKAEAGRLIATLPDAGRRSYELQYGARARKLLAQAVASGSPSELAEVARQFFFTEAGQEATFLLGRHHMDHDRPVAAALCFERLRAAGASKRLEPALSLSLAVCWLRAAKPERATSALLRLKRADPQAQIVVGGKSVDLFSDDREARKWMDDVFGPQRTSGAAAIEQWALFRGDESRNAPAGGGRPLLNVRWRQRTADDQLVEEFVDKVQRDYVSQEIVALPSFHALAVDDVVLMRTAFAVQAVDFKTGKLVWKYDESGGSLEAFLKVGNSPQSGRNVQLLSRLDQRLWEDAVYGTLSSDAKRVYYIDDLGLGVTGSPLMTVLPNGRRVYVNSQSANRLAARDLETQGKLTWEVGGTDGADEPQLAGAFFLGPPLPLLGQLYAIAEIKGQEIRLVVLSPETGALAWSQQLAVVDPPVTEDATRRNAGAAPSFADGVLVCPTSAGAVVAIDLTTRSLVWGYQYPRFQQNQVDRFNARRFAIYPGGERRADEHWVDGTVTIDEGRVLITPVESDQMYCLDLETGKELWSKDRDENLYVACIHDGRLILVGRDAVTALDLDDGSDAWPALELPPGSMPSGRGFASGDAYYLPLTSAEVAKIDLGNGRLLERARSRSGTVPGNLICFRDSVISQGPDYVDAYYQLDALKQQVAATLRDKPDDPGALASLAAVKLDEDSLGEAIDLLRRSYATQPVETTREQLIAALVEGLSTDFAVYRDSIDELDGLIDSPQQRLLFLRVVAGGLQAAGEVLPAFNTYLQLVDSEDSSAPEAIDDVLSVSRPRWIRAQIKELREMAASDERQRIDEEVGARLKAALAADSSDVLRRYLDVFGSIAAGAPARATLVGRLDEHHLLECEALVRGLDRWSSSAETVTAMAHLARLLDDSGQPGLAAAYYDQLATRFAEVAGADGKTGQQLVAALPDDSPVRRQLAGDESWPAGKITDRRSSIPATTSSQRAPRSVNLEVVGPSGPLFTDLDVSLNLQTQVMVGRNRLGVTRFRIPIHEPGSRQSSTNRFNVYNAPPLSYVSVNGGLLVLSMSNRVIAVDTMRGSGRSPKGILWTQDLSDQIGGFQTSQGIYSRPVAVPWGGTRYVPEDTVGRRYGSIGPVTDEGVYFQRLRDLYCVDPLSGKTLWTRKSVGLGNHLFGDEELLFVAPAAGDDTLVVRASTGEELGTRDLVPFEQRMTTVGRNVLSWESQGAQQLLAMRDPWEDEVLWSFNFASGSKAALVSHDAVGVMQPDGEFSLVRFADGKPLVHEKLEPEKSLVGIHLLRSENQYLLVTNSSARLDGAPPMQRVAAAASFPMVNGRVYSFDAQSGKLSWPAPAVVPQYGLVAQQPAGLPLLVFVRTLQPQRATNRRRANTSLLCIDKRTGRVAYENDDLPATLIGNLELSGDPTRGVMSLEMPPQLVELTITDEPLPESSSE